MVLSHENTSTIAQLIPVLYKQRWRHCRLPNIGSAMWKIDFQELTSKHPTNVRLGAKYKKPDWRQIPSTPCSRNLAKYLQITRWSVAVFTEMLQSSQYLLSTFISRFFWYQTICGNIASLDFQWIATRFRQKFEKYYHVITAEAPSNESNKTLLAQTCSVAV